MSSTEHGSEPDSADKCSPVVETYCEEERKNASHLLWQLVLAYALSERSGKSTPHECHEKSYWSFNPLRFRDALVTVQKNSTTINSTSCALALPDLECGIQEQENAGGKKSQCPFLLRFTITVYGITMGLGSHAFMWKTVAVLSSADFERFPRILGAIFWMLSLLHLLIFTILYLGKLIRWPKAVLLEFQHPVRSNFFAAPFISGLYLIVGSPKVPIGYLSETTLDPKSTVNVAAATLFTGLLLVYEVHVYGRWMVGKTYQLAQIANPTTQIAIIGNFVSAATFSFAEWKQVSLFLFTVGTVHQLVVFKVVFTRLNTDKIIGMQLRPTYFLFVAHPSVAAVAWTGINGSVDNLASGFTFTAVFFLVILISRINFFFSPGVRFSLAWWAFTFPSAAITMALVNFDSSRLSTTVYFGEMGPSGVVKTFTCSLLICSSFVLLVVAACTASKAASGQLFEEDEIVEAAAALSQ